MVQDLEQGDVSETVRKFYASYGEPKKRSTFTLREVDQFLDQFTAVRQENDQAKIFTKIMKRATEWDMKYIIMLIDHDLRQVNAGPKIVLDGFHRQAYDQFKVNNNLAFIVKKILNINGGGGDDDGEDDDDGNTSAAAAAAPANDDGNDQGGDDDDEEEEDDDDDKPRSKNAGAKNAGAAKKTAAGGKLDFFELNAPIKPMLARPAASIKDAITRCPNGALVEIKYDGERIQIHKDGPKFTFYSRSLKSVAESKVGPVRQSVPLATSAHSIILDSEILMVDNKTGAPLPFGTLGVHKQKGFQDASVCVVIFDILYLNGKSQLHKSMAERRMLLEQNVTPVKNRVLLSELQVIREEEDLGVMMNKIIKQGLEGLMVKDIGGPYHPGARHWIKIKKMYLENLADTVDLVCVGGYYGTGKKGGIISTFLMATYDAATRTWRTVAKVANGFSDARLAELQDEIDMVKIQRDHDRVPDWLECHRMHTPDIVVRDPKAAPVWEIGGAEFSKSSHHTAGGYSIRFPILERERDDKNWKTATNLEEFLDMVKGAKHIGEEDQETSAAFAKIAKTKSASAKELEKFLDMRGVPVSKASDESSSSASSSSSAAAPATDAAAPKSSTKKPSPAITSAATAASASSSSSSSSSAAKSRNVAKVVDQDDQDDEDDDDESSTAKPNASSASVKEVSGDLLNPSHGGRSMVVIAHCVDDSGKWGSRGLFGKISAKWPKVASEMVKFKKSRKNCNLGDVQLVEVESAPGAKVVFASLLCLDSQQRDKTGAPVLELGKLRKCVQELAKFVTKSATDADSIPHIHMVKMASAGTVWDDVVKVLKSHGGANVEYRVHTSSAKEAKAADGQGAAAAAAAPAAAPAAAKAAANAPKADMTNEEDDEEPAAPPKTTPFRPRRVVSSDASVLASESDGAAAPATPKVKSDTKPAAAALARTATIAVQPEQEEDADQTDEDLTDADSPSPSTRRPVKRPYEMDTDDELDELEREQQQQKPVAAKAASTPAQSKRVRVDSDPVASAASPARKTSSTASSKATEAPPQLTPRRSSKRAASDDATDTTPKPVVKRVSTFKDDDATDED
ncbi:zinc finger protein [Capsaspora owczarzaki ATCC 30864]|nr:zinc finger protein [Capsaspora owczarzaki ATCC 30864]|eukprot:XP_004364566.2 zinc finger protein [Capsaspora owczarzaki ATCC 30864]